MFFFCYGKCNISHGSSIILTKHNNLLVLCMACIPVITFAAGKKAWHIRKQFKATSPLTWAWISTVEANNTKAREGETCQNVNGRFERKQWHIKQHCRFNYCPHSRTQWNTSLFSQKVWELDNCAFEKYNTDWDRRVKGENNSISDLILFIFLFFFIIFLILS